MLESWPFATVPDRNRASLWIGRPEMLARLNALLAGWRRRRASDITVLWADFGQGKTHALLHLHGELAAKPNSLAHYVQLPPLTAGSPFVALYRQVLRDFPLDLLGKRVFERYRDDVRSIFTAAAPGDRQIHQLLWLVGTSSPGRDVATRWFRGERVAPNDLKDLVLAGKRLSIGPPPQTAQDCENVLDTLLNTAINFPAEDGGEFVLLVDEFQRIGELSPRKRTEVCDALHLLFNRRPQGFRLVLAFAGGLPEIVSGVLTGDLQARVTTKLSLPPMTPSQGRAYFEDLVRAYLAVGEEFPFESDSVDEIVRLADPAGVLLTPRKINITADVLTNEALTQRVIAASDTGDHPIVLHEIRDAAQAVGNDLLNSLGAVE